MKSSTIGDWSMQSLRDAFQLRRSSAPRELLEWTSVERGELTDAERRELAFLRGQVDDHAPGWSEEEVKLHFLGPLFHLVNFEGEDYNFFAGRTLTGVVDGHEIQLHVQGLVARGHWDPVLPYICVHAYESEKGRDGQPLVETLSAMLVTRALNADGRTVYGAYLLGRFWFFLTLDGTQPEYGLSRAYDTGSEDIEDVFLILWRVRRIAEEGVAALAKAG